MDARAQAASRFEPARNGRSARLGLLYVHISTRERYRPSPARAVRGVGESLAHQAARFCPHHPVLLRPYYVPHAVRVERRTITRSQAKTEESRLAAPSAIGRVGCTRRTQAQSSKRASSRSSRME